MKKIAALVFILFASSVFAHSSHMTEDMPDTKPSEMKEKEATNEKRKSSAKGNEKNAPVKTNEPTVEERRNKTF